MKADYTPTLSELPHADVSAIQLRSVSLLYGIIHRAFVCELDLASSPRPASLPVGHHPRVRDLAKSCKMIRQAVRCGLKRQVPHEDSRTTALALALAPLAIAIE